MEYGTVHNCQGKKWNKKYWFRLISVISNWVSRNVICSIPHYLYCYDSNGKSYIFVVFFPILLLSSFSSFSYTQKISNIIKLYSGSLETFYLPRSLVLCILFLCLPLTVMECLLSFVEPKITSAAFPLANNTKHPQICICLIVYTSDYIAAKWEMGERFLLWLAAVALITSKSNTIVGSYKYLCCNKNARKEEQNKNT